jgi:diguanylate cyclase (GGDEF)-like protein
MDYARSGVPGNALLRVGAWPVWSLSRKLRAFVLLVICADLACVGVSAASYRFSAHNLALFAALLGCVAVTVELTRRAGEPAGVVKDVYAVWELPVVILLPPLYALVIPALRLALTQWRVRQAPLYRRVFTAAAIGLAYGSAWLVFHGIVPGDGDGGARDYLWGHPEIWLVAAAACGLVQWAVNEGLVLTAVRLADPTATIRARVFGREDLHNDATELCAALLVALGLTVSALTLIVALPLATLLQRSFRHTQLLSEARADAKTGLLNAATWEREAAAEVDRAVRTRAPLAVALLDLDRFKQINDTYGHLLGDEVLRQIAATMNEVLRDYDLAGRFGGEEFVMLLPQTRAVDAFRIAERVRAHIAQLPIYAAGRSGASGASGASGSGAHGAAGAPGSERVPVTASIGVAALDAGSRRELTELLAAADAALYRAKASGRDQVQMISTSRGLSAARPPAAGDAAATARVWGGSVPSGAERPVEGVVRDIYPEYPERPQLRVDAEDAEDAVDAADPVEAVGEGTASTATTSALAV